MDTERKRQVLEHRRALLREHIDIVGISPGFERALERTLRELELLEPAPARS